MALKRVRRPSSFRLATQLFRKQSAASITIARLMLRSYPGRLALWCWWAVCSLAEGRAGGESAAILFLAALPPRIRPSFEIFGGFPKSSKSCPPRSTTPSPTWSPTTLAYHQRHAQRKLRPIYFCQQSKQSQPVGNLLEFTEKSPANSAKIKMMTYRKSDVVSKGVCVINGEFSGTKNIRGKIRV